MRSRVGAVERLLCTLLALFVLWQPTWSAIVAQEKVKEMIQQAHDLLNASLSQDELHLFEVGLGLGVGGEKGTTEFVQPLSLQLTVLDLTNALSREMNLPKWQAMLRALGGDREILKRFAQMRPHFALLEGRLKQNQEGGLDQQLDQLAALNTSTTWTRIWPQLKTLIENVANLYDWFDRYQRNAAVVNERTLRDYAEAVHSKDGLTLAEALHLIHQQVCPSGTDDQDLDDMEMESASFHNDSVPCSGGLGQSLQDALKQAGDSFICSLPTSTHQLVYDLYALIALTEAKGYAMMQFSWMLLRLYDRGATSENFAAQANQARTVFENRIIEKAEAARNILSKVTTWHWKCDTPASDQLEHETFVQFNELLQGYVVNEVDLNQDNTCKESCSAYTNSQEKGCFGNQFCAQSRRCPSGRIYNCGFIEADSNICTSATPGRRYDWIEYKSGKVLGQKSECKAPNNKYVKVNSWWRWVFWHCSYCMCLCDQPGKHSDRYVSLQSALAATSSNHLVTGVRFIKKNRIVHIQIQEGQALPRGLVNESTISWQPVPSVTVHKDQEDSIEDGLGYATLSYQERALDLDDLHAPDGHVITGLRFRKLGGHLNLEAQASPIEFSTGMIDIERAIWISNDNTPAAETKPRTKMSLLSPDVPTRSRIQSVPDSSTDQFIEFQATSLERDVSQNTVPFIEITPVSAQPPTWLTGIGVYHKGQPGYGGFVAFRIATINYTDYMAIPSKNFSYTPEEDITG